MTEPPIGYTRLLDAVDAVGRRMKGSRWRPAERIVGPYSPLSSGETMRDADFDEVITTIANRCAAGGIATAYRTFSGKLEKLDPGEWLQPHWRNYFATGTIELILPLVDGNGRPTADGVTSRCEREIFVRWEDADRFIQESCSRPRVRASRAAGAQRLEKLGASYKSRLARDAGPSMKVFVALARENGFTDLNVMRDEYRRQFPDRRRGRPEKMVLRKIGEK
jgi:hypothetical protein